MGNLTKYIVFALTLGVVLYTIFLLNEGPIVKGFIVEEMNDTGEVVALFEVERGRSYEILYVHMPMSAAYMVGDDWLEIERKRLTRCKPIHYKTHFKPMLAVIRVMHEKQEIDIIGDIHEKLTGETDENEDIISFNND